MNSDLRSKRYLPANFDCRHNSGKKTRENSDVVQHVLDFFSEKGLLQIKEEDRQEKWYEDWVAYQAQHKIYSRLLCPKLFSSAGLCFDLRKIVEFVEAIAYFSPAHGYSFQVTFLGLFPILMRAPEGFKRKALGDLEKGSLFAFGVSEKEHGSDLYSNKTIVQKHSDGRYSARGSKYYIGNANSASTISVLGQFDENDNQEKKERFVFFGLNPKETPSFKNLTKIRTMGVRSAFVGAFEIEDYRFGEENIFARGRAAWDAVFGTVNMGKFFLGFGSIGICEHALAETLTHTRKRVLFGTPVAKMPHIHQTLILTYARLSAMRLYAYRALDYFQRANTDDRRFLLFNSVQKAKVSTEGVKVMDQLLECLGAKGFESDTYFEMALRDARLIPGLEGSTHINFGLIAQFLKSYFFGPRPKLAFPPAALAENPEITNENAYLFEYASGGLKEVCFAPPFAAYRPLRKLSNVRIFEKQVRAFRSAAAALIPVKTGPADADRIMALGRSFATIVYGQLIAENAVLVGAEPSLINLIFHLLIEDLASLSLQLANLPKLGSLHKFLFRRVVAFPQTTTDTFEEVASLMDNFIDSAI